MIWGYKINFGLHVHKARTYKTKNVFTIAPKLAFNTNFLPAGSSYHTPLSEGNLIQNYTDMADPYGIQIGAYNNEKTKSENTFQGKLKLPLREN